MSLAPSDPTQYWNCLKRSVDTVPFLPVYGNALRVNEIVAFDKQERDGLAGDTTGAEGRAEAPQAVPMQGRKYQTI